MPEKRLQKTREAYDTFEASNAELKALVAAGGPVTPDLRSIGQIVTQDISALIERIKEGL